MLEIALQITLCLLIAALIGFILGFIVAKSTNKKTDDKKSTKKKNEKKKLKSKEKVPVIEKTIEDEIETLIETVSEEEIEIPTADATLKAVEAQKELDTTEEAIITGAPELLDVPRDNKKDTLTQIKGIGPKVEEQLNTTGIYHFEQIANWSEANIQWLEANTTFAHRAKKDLWVNQAKSLI